MGGNCAGTFPTFIKGCTNSDSCSFGFHEINCCGSMDAVGFNHSQRDAFNAAEMAWEMTCGGCACPATLPLAEDGKTCQMNQVTVSCDNGVCTTHCP